MEPVTGPGWDGLAAVAARAAGAAAGEEVVAAGLGAAAGAKAAADWVGAGANANGGITWAACLASGISSPRE